MKKIIFIMVAVFLICFSAVGAQANLITFDDLATPNSGGGVSNWGLVPNAYDGFNWVGWEVTQGTGAGNSYVNVYNNTDSIPSDQNFIYNGGDGNLVVTTSSGTEFDFLSAYLSSFVQNNTLQGFSATSVTIEGYLGATLVQSDTVDLTNQFVKYTFAGFTDIDTLKFTSTAEGKYYGMDNFESAPVPEPATLLLMGLGSGIMGAGIKRLRKKFRKNEEVVT
jgi:hypothetical protein